MFECLFFTLSKTLFSLTQISCHFSQSMTKMNEFDNEKLTKFKGYFHQKTKTMTKTVRTQLEVQVAVLCVR